MATAFATFAGSAVPAMASVAACPAAPTSNPFAPWGDDADYQLAPGGSLEGGAAGWALANGASVAEGNESFMATSPSDHLSLRMPGTSAATTARMCVGVEHPSFRFFVRRASGAAASTLQVDVVYSDASGREQSLPVGTVAGSDAWAPTQALPTMVQEIGATGDSTVSISFRFRSQGGGTWSVDDLYVDPHRIP